MRAIVLGAGKGKRLLSEKHDLPKVLREANGKSLIEYVLDEISFINQEDICIVAGYKKEKVLEKIKGNYKFAYQLEQLGTGHAVKMAKDCFDGYKGNVLIAYGDMPLFKRETFENLINKHEESGAKCTVLTSVEDRKLAYGRIIRNEQGEFGGVVEQKDCTEEQAKIKELNVGVYVFDSEYLFGCLDLLNNSNAQKEYYLTDIPKIMLEKGERVNTFTLQNSDEILGVNTPEELEECERILKERA